ncbi:MAG: two-component system LytT family response regulator [Saprospiraceae bacterium]|jgi:two-component system LytT family response regulator
MVLNDRIGDTYNSSEKIILKDGESMQMVLIADILYCNAEGSYTTFHLDGYKQIITSLNLKEYERMLSPYGFIRSNHSYLVNLNHIVSIQKSDGGYIIMSDDSNLPLSIRKKATLVEALKSKFVG